MNIKVYTKTGAFITVKCTLQTLLNNVFTSVCSQKGLKPENTVIVKGTDLGSEISWTKDPLNQLLRLYELGIKDNDILVLIPYKKSMQKILDDHQYDRIDIFAAKFVKDVIEESYGTSIYFNLKTITEASIPLIKERIEIFKSDPDITKDSSISWDIGHILPIKITTDFQFNEKYNNILMTYAIKNKQD